MLGLLLVILSNLTLSAFYTFFCLAPERQYDVFKSTICPTSFNAGELVIRVLMQAQAFID